MKLYFLLLITIAIANAASVGNIIDAEVPPAMISTTGTTLTTKLKRYFIVPYIKANWMVANMYCQSLGMRPISILSMQEHNAVVKAIEDADLTTEDFWTSGRRIDNTMYWFDIGEKFNFTNWGEGEPNNKYGDEECIGLYEYVQLKWNDFNCERRINIMCEKDVMILQGENKMNDV